MLAEFTLPFLPKVAQSLGMPGYELRALLAVLFVTTVCGLVGALVVGNRMAFFSDAMSHCAFAGISLGLLIALSSGLTAQSDEVQWLVPLVMATFGALVGVGIAFVRENTALASDTVIGVFFAGAIGFGAMLLTAFSRSRLFDPERFLFGGPVLVRDFDLITLAVILVATAGVLAWRYNQFVLASLNPSLARSRGIKVAFNNYVFIVLLALIVNFSISAVGVLLINAMLIVPAATASNLAQDMRGLFRYTLGLSVGTGLVGLYLSLTVRFEFGAGQFGASGAIICLGVILFALSLIVPVLRTRLARFG